MCTRICVRNCTLFFTYAVSTAYCSVLTFINVIRYILHVGKLIQILDSFPQYLASHCVPLMFIFYLFYFKMFSICIDFSFIISAQSLVSTVFSIYINSLSMCTIRILWCLNFHHDHTSLFSSISVPFDHNM